MLIALCLSFFTQAHAIVLDPALRAADEVGYEVVGDLEFRRGSLQLSERQLRDTVHEAQTLCPSADTRETHFVVLAWSDREFPGSREAGYSSQQTDLADRRAREVEARLRENLRWSSMSFERVNMATRVPQRVRAGSRAVATATDVKQVMKLAGAAPSGEWELGLFGELGQHSKALIWLDCAPGEAPGRPLSRAANVQLARIDNQSEQFVSKLK